MSIYKHKAEVFQTKKALSCANEDLKILGIEHTLININLPALMKETPDSDDIRFLSGDRTFYFSSAQVEKIDQFLRAAWKYKIAATAILLNAPRMFDSNQEKALLNKVIHPQFDWNSAGTYISAFNMENEEARAYYRAFVEFLSSRYMRDDAEYGRITGFIVSNEVNSQYVWGNAGSMSVQEYVRQYTQALRITWEASHMYWEHAGVYVSLDHYWTDRFWPAEPLKTYCGRDVVDLVSKYAKEAGDFGWGIAYHPYPEDLNYPDFYNDRIPTFYFDTKEITFKNIEVLPAYLEQERFLYHGRRRPVILSEQGFNAGNDEFTELQGAAAYTLAYQKVKQQEGILWMTHHAYLDNPLEFGLHLGIRERTDDGRPGRKRPVYNAIADMGSENEAARVQWARSFIGEPLFDRLVSPEVHRCEEDKSKETEFGN